MFAPGAWVCAQCKRTKSVTKTRAIFSFMTNDFVICYNCIRGRNYSHERGN